jgi:hypothetical protein
MVVFIHSPSGTKIELIKKKKKFKINKLTVTTSILLFFKIKFSPSTYKNV